VSTPVERQTFDFPDFCKTVGIGQTTGRKLIRQGRLPIIRIAARVVIARNVVEAILRGELDLSEHGTRDDCAA
jgi:hypothetical protein